MDKLSVLKGYRKKDPPQYYRIRDTWSALGSNLIRKNTRIYNEGMIYKVYPEDHPNSSLRGSLVFCAKEFIGNLNWNNAVIIDEDYGEISFGNDIVSSRFYQLLSGEELDSVEEAIDESFIPFQEIYEQNDTVKIKDSDYRTIMSCLGAPFIRDEELEYTREEISELAIKPALELMFKWCPKTRPQEIAVTLNVQNIPMPEDAYAVLGLSLQQAGMGTGTITNPLLWGLMNAPYLSLGSGITEVSAYGNPLRGSDNSNSLLLGNASMQGLINYRRRVHYEGPYEDLNGSICPEPGQRYITVYSNIQGTLNVWWGIRTLNFDDIEYAQRDNAFKLCKAKVKQLFGALRRQSKSDIPGQVDYGYLVEEGKTEENEVIDVMKKLVKSSGILRGSL